MESLAVLAGYEVSSWFFQRGRTYAEFALLNPAKIAHVGIALRANKKLARVRVGLGVVSVTVGRLKPVLDGFTIPQRIQQAPKTSGSWQEVV